MIQTSRVKTASKHAHEIALLSLVSASAAVWSSLYVMRYNLF